MVPVESLYIVTLPDRFMLGMPMTHPSVRLTLVSFNVFPGLVASAQSPNAQRRSVSALTGRPSKCTKEPYPSSDAFVGRRLRRLILNSTAMMSMVRPMRTTHPPFSCPRTYSLIVWIVRSTCGACTPGSLLSLTPSRSRSVVYAAIAFSPSQRMRPTSYIRAYAAATKEVSALPISATVRCLR